MKIVITESQYEQLSEMIKLNIKVGDTIMGGKFKNKKIVVKTISKNEKGDITINGKPLLRFRIIK
jgi:co-chaperonin GroES (HSP10)